ncbi:hypothetical protein EV180_002441 [Coemansia sp. RSA 518]|nr:hypothetical protein EV180_002441 [Coemansia sp. RSA 518]KAJ2284429.1 hypothetical protein GGH14_000141 [Coemansia sp. RSA 370]KAJ2292993.1 hypothetical protein IW141_001471 [Coemansia sp. RSA 355]
MAKSAIDCHFYLTGSCRNGDSCPFRHSEGARTTQEECEEFSALGQCSSHDCGKRHSETKRTKPPSEVQCRNEESGTCTRVGCIFKHTGQRAQLNARAKAFVPRGAQGSRMEWTPESSISNVQSGSFGNKEWTPRAHTESNQPAFGNMEWVPNAAPQSQSFGNKELTPAANAKPAMTQAFGNKEWTPAGVPKPTMTQAFGNKEWTPAAATETAPKPKFGNKEWTPAAATKPVTTQSFGNKEWTPAAAVKPTIAQAFGNKEWTPAAATKPAMTQAFGNKEWTPASATQPAMAQSFGNKEWTPSAQTESTQQPKFGNKEWTPAAAAKPTPDRTFGNKEWKPNATTAAPEPIQTIYDILGISEQNPQTSIEKHRREAHPKRNIVQQNEVREASNSPVSRVCYAEEFPSYFGAHEEQESEEWQSVVEKPEVGAVETLEPEPIVEPEAVVEPEPIAEPISEPMLEALEPSRETKSLLKTPKPTRQLPSIAPSNLTETKKPALKVLSFAEIMERKRRRNTTTEQPTEQPKKDTVTTEVKRPKVTNYVDLFERELAELNKELSGPLENTPESDRISRASLGEAIEYI